jgi:cytochrome c biogenesis protein CcdA
VVSLTLALSLIGLALVDSLNPSLFAAQFYLLTTPRPAARVASYIAGVLVVMIAGGLLILGGMRSVVIAFLESISQSAMYGAGFAVGVALAAFGWWFRGRTPSTAEARQPRSLRVEHTFLLGMAVMLNEITTALPYFAAIERIAQAQLATLANVLWLLLYNLIFSAPLWAFLLLFLRYRQRFTEGIERINRSITRWMPRAIGYASLAFGLLLMADSAVFWGTGRGLF